MSDQKVCSNCQTVTTCLELGCGQRGMGISAASAAELVSANVSAEWQPITKPGMVKKGDKLRFRIGDKTHAERAWLILNPGTDKGEVVYDKANNFYFITSMVMRNSSNHKDVEVLAAAATTEQPSLSVPPGTGGEQNHDAADLKTARATIRIMDQNKAGYLSRIAELEAALATRHPIAPELLAIAIEVRDRSDWALRDTKDREHLDRVIASATSSKVSPVEPVSADKRDAIDQDAPVKAGDQINDGIFTTTLDATGATMYNALKASGQPVQKVVSRAAILAQQANPTGEQQ